MPLREAGRQGWNLLREDLPLPVAVLKGSALAHNSRWMRGFLEHFDDGELTTVTLDEFSDLKRL